MSWASDMSGARPPIHTHRPCGESADVAYSPALAAALAPVSLLLAMLHVSTHVSAKATQTRVHEFRTLVTMGLSAKVSCRGTRDSSLVSNYPELDSLD
jgi:hypothetical protein